MKPLIRMIAIDLDGTLLNSKKKISERDSEALQAAVNRGVEIVPVTGRNFYFALSKVELLPFEVPVIASNGAIIPLETGTDVPAATVAGGDCGRSAGGHARISTIYCPHV